MDNLDLLIEMFEEAKGELQKAEALRPRIKTPPVAIPYVKRFKTPTVPSVSTPTVAEDKARAKNGVATVAKDEGVLKALHPDAKAHMLNDASRAAQPAAAPAVVKPGGVADRGPVQAKKDLNWLTGQSPHDLTPVPAGNGKDIPGFERQEISFSKNGQWNMKKGVNTIGAGGTNDDSI